MSIRSLIHEVKVKYDLRRTFDVDGISQIRQRHENFYLMRDRIREAGTDSLPFFGNGYTHEGGLYLQQNPDEFAALTLFLRERGPFANYLEIGSASGGAGLFLYREIGFRSIISLDDGKHPRAPVQAELFGQIKNLKQFIGDSHSTDAFRFLEKNVEGKLDVAFIDGDHSFEGVWQDIQLTRHFCRPGSLMVFHDTLFCEGVYRAWRKSAREKTFKPIAEFVGDEQPLGIGVAEII